MTANAVFTEHRVGAFQGCGDTNLDLLLRDCSPRKQQAAQRDQSQTALQHCLLLVSSTCFALDRIACDRALWTSQESYPMKPTGRMASLPRSLTASLILHVAPQRGKRP